jgi:protein involved in polysaccharide export with SLBB domain
VVTSKLQRGAFANTFVKAFEYHFYSCFDRFHNRPSSSMLAYVPGDKLIVEVVDKGETQAQAVYKEFFTVRTPQQVEMLLYYSVFMLLLFHFTSVSVRAQKIIFTH